MKEKTVAGRSRQNLVESYKKTSYTSKQSLSSTDPVTVRFPRELLTEVEEAAEQLGTNRSQVIRSAVKEVLG